MKQLFTTLKARRISGGNSITKLISLSVKHQLLTRTATIFLMTALLLPVIYIGSRQPVGAASQFTSAPAAPISAPALLPPAAPSALPPGAVLSFVPAITQSLLGTYQSVTDFFVSPPLPEGLVMAAVPTVWEKIAAVPSSVISALSSHLTALLFVSPNKPAAAAAPPAPPSPPVPMTATAATTFDFDGDGYADIGRWRAGVWKIRNSSSESFTTTSYPGAGTAIAPADYDGDGITDRAVFTDYAGKCDIIYSSTGVLHTVNLGIAGDKVVSGNYHGTDNKADFAVWRPSNGSWYINGTANPTQFGAAGDTPVPGDYDGDGKMDFAVFRPSSTGGVWIIKRSTDGAVTFQGWGENTDTPVPADYDGDGKTDYATYRPGIGTWLVLKSSTGSTVDLSKMWGNYGDQPVPADYDGDGKADFAIWRPTTGVWHIINSSYGNGQTSQTTLGIPEYSYYQLGAAGDTAVPSAYLKQTGEQLLAYKLANARLAPLNATGGTNLYSRNFFWGAGLVNLPGRAGLDLNLGISYNSLVWTKETNSSVNTMVFDADHANISPGFNFGFPTIEPGYYNEVTGKLSYLMVTPSGGRVEFRQIAVSGIYEAADSSYAQLRINPRLGGRTPSFAPSGGGGGGKEEEDLTMTVTTTDGTQMDYDWKAGAYRVNQIKDRNGNFISVGYDSDYGLLQGIVDTLGRVITVNYDSEFYPTSITQEWKTGNGDGGDEVTHTYATFTYTRKAISPTFTAGMNIYGPSGGVSFKVLNNITYADLSTTSFLYNDFGQVKEVINKAPNDSFLNSTGTNLATPGTGEPDCPRFSETYRTIADVSGTPATTTIRTDFADTAVFTFDGGGTATSVDVWVVGAPQNVHSKSWFYHDGNWAGGLPLGSEDIADGVRQRWTHNTWKQDDESKSYIINPRVKESKVGDTGNIKKTELSYWETGSLAGLGLVKEVKISDGMTGALQKRSVTSYKDDTAYLSRRIIGLPAHSELYDGSSSLMSKVTYDYDGGDFSAAGQSVSPAQHDHSKYGAGLIVGRGNLTQTTRCDAAISSEMTCGGGTSSQIKYNTAGSAVAQIDPLGREVKIGYADNFNDGVNRVALAYPTTLTDPAGYSSQVQYRYDTGANVWAKSPTPYSGTGNTPNSGGKETRRTFDELGRLQKQAVIKNNAEYAYTRYVYPTNQIQSQVYSTVTAGMGEVLSESWTDGAGRIRSNRTAHPGSAGGWSETQTEYNILGQVKRTSAPTEVNSNGQLAGDGQTRGWLWNEQEYDWKGRVTKSTNTDGTFSTAAYDGCGCAGGEIVTVEGEQLADGRRKQKIYSDILGRQSKTEVLDWNGAVYAATVTKFNGRDQAVWVKQFVGAAPADALSSDSCPVPAAGAPPSCQITSMTYDGNARLKTQHTPQQEADKATTYDYYQNDEVQQVTDARGATAIYSYNNRGLVTGINYSVPAGAANRPSAPPPGNAATTGLPLGFLDVINLSTQTAEGWSFDPDNSGASNSVDLYIDPPAGGGTGTFLGRVVADKQRPDVNNVYHVAGNHGFELVIPSQYFDGGQHRIFAYGIKTNNNGSRQLDNSPKSFAYSPNPVVTPPINSSVAFDYDAAGNRLWMTDNLGRTDYEYDGLSRLTAETRKLTDTAANGTPLVMANAPLPNNGFKLQYSYGLANQLTSLTDPFGAVVNYDYDQAGRLKKVAGTSFGGVTTYADHAEYQAWGGLKKLDYGSGAQMQMSYNNRLQADNYTLAGGMSGQLMSKHYDYYADGSLRYAQDLLDPKFDRLNNYDYLGRIKEGKTGLEARGNDMVPQSEQSTSLPYRQKFEFDAFNNLTKRENRHWGIETWYGQNNNLNYEYQNNRVAGAGWIYDADGRNLQTALPDDYTNSTYNAAGQMIRSQSGQNADSVRFYDGNGREVKRSTANFIETQTTASWVLQPTKYYIRSSILSNEVVSEVWANGKKGKTFVRAAGSQLAWQSAYASDTAALFEAVFFEYSDVAGMSQRTTDKLGQAVASGNNGDGVAIELDPLGNSVGTSTPYIEPLNGGGLGDYNPLADYPMLQDFFVDQPLYVNGQRVTCAIDGLAIGCRQALDALSNGSAVPSNLVQYNNAVFGLGLGGSVVEVPSNDIGGQNALTSGNYYNGVVNVFAQPSTFIFVPSYSVVSWNPRQQTPLPIPPQTAGGNDVSGGRGGGNGNGHSQTGIPQDCIDALKDLGVWDKVQELLKNPPLIDIDSIFGYQNTKGETLFNGGKPSAERGYYPVSISNLPGKLYLGTDALVGETVGQAFGRSKVNALTERGGASITGIYYSSSRYDIRKDTYLLIHEITHLAYPPGNLTKGVDLDEALVRDLQITPLKGEIYTDTVSRFFNNKCEKSLRNFGVH